MLFRSRDRRKSNSSSSPRIIVYEGASWTRRTFTFGRSSAIAGENPVLLAATGEAYWQYVNAGISGESSYLDKAEACARRELCEEAGYRAGRLEPLGEALADPGLTDERLFLFVARDLAPVPRQLDADEHIEVTAVPLAEAYRMIERGEILDAGTLVALLRLRLREEARG